MPQSYRFVGQTATTTLAAIFLTFFLSMFGAPAAAQDQTVGLFLYDTAAYEGYTLYSPLRYSATYLIDMYGRLVHQWDNDFPAGNSVYLLENGNLLRPSRPDNGGGGLIQEIDWDGNVVWSYTYYNDSVRQHHDIEPLPNGNILILAWEFLSEEEALANGRDTAQLDGDQIWPEHVIEVEPTGSEGGNIVWEWHLWDHIIQDFDSTQLNYGVVAEHPELVDVNFYLQPISDWNHANAIDYNAQLDQIVISSRSFSEFWVIDHSTSSAEAASHSGGLRGKGGDLLYRWGNPIAYDRGTEDDQQLFVQHDAQWIAPGLPGEGHFLVFNNGGRRLYSTVDEIISPVDIDGFYTTPAPGEAYAPDTAAWAYVADPPGDFFGSFISGATRMPNGNTLICEGPTGRFFEVNAAGEKVWEYKNPIGGGGTTIQGAGPLGTNTFRCYRYTADYPGLAGRNLSGGATLEINPVMIAHTATTPAKPTANDSTRILSVITADSGLGTVTLWVDTGDGFYARTMYDDGLHGDDLPGDTRFAAYVPRLEFGTMVSYYIEANNSLDQTTFDPLPAAATVYSYEVEYGPARLYLNELLAQNISCCTDPMGEYDDFIELYCAEPDGLALDSFFVTDDPLNTTKVPLAGLSISFDGFLLLWADGQPEQGTEHLSFSLADGGGWLGLYVADSSGVYLVDSVSYGGPGPDISYGRVPDGNDYWALLDETSPGGTNAGLICGDIDGSLGNPDIADLVFLVDYMFNGGAAPPQIWAADIDGSGGDPDIADLVYLVRYMFQNGPAPACL